MLFCNKKYCSATYFLLKKSVQFKLQRRQTGIEHKTRKAQHVETKHNMKSNKSTKIDKK